MDQFKYIFINFITFDNPGRQRNPSIMLAGTAINEDGKTAS